MKITFIGGGNMAFALISGLMRQGYGAKQIDIVEIDADRRSQIKDTFGIIAVSELADLVDGISRPVKENERHIIVLAVKPQQMYAMTRYIAGLLDQQLIISIAAGIRTIDIMRWLGGYPRVIRAMPNTPSLVRAGVTGLYAAPETSEMDRCSAESILGAVGSVLWVDDEEMLHTVTAISGSGPAYVFYFIESMQQAGIKLGLTLEQSRQLSLQTFEGAVKLANESQEDVSVLRAKVTSKGGTTQQAIQSMEDNHVKNAIMTAVEASYARSQEMSDEYGKM
ncbi:MAG: pyrroline-5-carboxylate reductase [Nitrosomonas sp.]|nr:pyrroline-5-carboxylate reductase [Nitrosomonas sp.]